MPLFSPGGEPQTETHVDRVGLLGRSWYGNEVLSNRTEEHNPEQCVPGTERGGRVEVDKQEHSPYSGSVSERGLNKSTGK